MDEKTTIYDIAKKLNITAATVSRALNDNPRISKKTRDLVKETAAKMNYKQNKLALALKRGKSYNVGVIVPHINRNFFSSVIRGVEEELYPQGYHVIISQTHEIESKEIETINTLLNAQVDGIIMSISKATIGVEHFSRVLKKNIPLVFFDRKKDIAGVSSVTVDDFKGSYLATKHLIEQGCKRICHFSGDQALDIYKNRFEGYKKALLDSNIEFNEEYVTEVMSDLEDGKKTIQKMMKLKNPPDALFSSSDFAALGAIQQLKADGIQIPEEFCVVGFSNEPFTKFMELSISSVDQSPKEMGRMAAKVFLEQVGDSQNVKIEKKVVLSPKLHIRKSSSRK
ncbi:LacI family DNA-binding transcriptional regulator [Abyssalbus ytuae]|uniref:LacI family transcriptional regulator n=1 Tax=Abyssalbus ytuae TaxID=2926907 RepID=A0A9E6ZVY1_9FLAO|nr:LacI family DNA-binding transcriptional regulator [Abyssalbus ytuae]UOB17791.1 LacI family transcriptional regulator [Abyssalbus ytuae]